MFFDRASNFLEVKMLKMSHCHEKGAILELISRIIGNCREIAMMPQRVFKTLSLNRSLNIPLKSVGYGSGEGCFPL